jgi:hypothetical protein
MASEQEVTYHRSFLSPRYMDNFRTITLSERLKRRAEDVEAIRLNDAEAFENARQALAQLLRVPFRRGYMQVYRGDQGGRDHWVSGNPSDAQVAECMVPLCPPQGAVKSPTTGMVALPNVGFTHSAFVQAAKHLHPVDMYPKLDQSFEEYATSWELAWSNLNSPYNRGFTPIVDRSWSVIGHVGTVPGGSLDGQAGRPSLIVPGEFAGISIEGAMEQGVPVFVHSATGLPSGWVNGNFYTSENKIQVRTAIDGEVVDFQVSSTGFLVQPWYSPIDLYCAGKVLVNLGKLGVRLTATLLRKATARLEARTAMRGATEALAKEAGEDAAKGEAKQLAARGKPALPPGTISEAGELPIVRLGRYGRPGNLNGYVKVVGNEVTYKVEAIVLDGAETAAEEAAVRTARQAHREMIVRAAKEAQKRGQKRFKLYGDSTSPAFRRHADDLARELGVPGSGRRFTGPLPDRPHYEVTLDVAKVLKSNP